MNPYRILRDDVLDAVVESKVDHVEDTVSTNCRSYTFIDSSKSHAILFNYLLRHLPSTRRLFGSVKRGAA